MVTKEAKEALDEAIRKLREPKQATSNEAMDEVLREVESQPVRQPPAFQPPISGPPELSMAERIALFESGSPYGSFSLEDSPFARMEPRRPLETILQALDTIVGKPFDALAEETFRALTHQRPAGEPTFNPLTGIRQSSEAFRERPLAAQLALSLIDPSALVARAPGGALRAAPGRLKFNPQSLLADRPPTFQPAQAIGGLQGGPVQGPVIRQLSPEQIPPSLRPDAAPAPESLDDAIARLQAEPVSAETDEALLFAAGEQNRLREAQRVADVPSTQPTGPLDLIQRAAATPSAPSVSVPRPEVRPITPIAPSVPAGTTTRILQPLSSEVETSLEKLVGLADSARVPNRAERIAGNLRRSEERSRRVGASRALEASLRESGVPAREAGQRANALLAGELPGPEFSPLDISSTEIGPLFEHVADIDLRYFTESNTRVALEKVLANEMPSPSELELLRQVFGSKLVDALKGKRSRLSGAGTLALDVFNAPRQILTAYDVSAPLRQGVVLLPGHPGKWSKSVVTMFKALASEGAAQADDLVRKSNPNWLRFTGRHAPGDSKNLFQADLSEGITALNFREEQFMSRLASKIPGIRQSQRAYVTFLNKLRFDVMTGIVEGWERTGQQFTDLDLDELALFLNRATGRGSLGEFGNKLAPVLNTVFFSPRLLASRVQLPGSLVSPSKLVRKQAATDLTKFVGTGTLVLTLASLGGAKVELNPRSSDFGKIRMGNTSVDFWGGFQSLARYGAQFLLGESKSVSGKSRGNIKSIPRLRLASGGAEFDDPVWLRFMRSKLSPTAGFVADETVFGQENFIGEPTFGHEDFEETDIGLTSEFPFLEGDLPSELGRRLSPLFFQDMLDAFKDDRIKGLFKAVSAGGGTSVVTFERGIP